MGQVKSKIENAMNHRHQAEPAKDAPSNSVPQPQQPLATDIARVEQRAEQWIAAPEDAAPQSADMPPPPDPDDGSGVIVTEVNIDPVAAMKAIEEAFPTATGSRVGPEDFEPIKVLGDGCFGKVMLVRRKGTNDVFAMKSIHKDHVIKNKKVRHTKTERNVMTQLRHPFIMQLHFAFQSGGKLYLVMDYFSGGDMFFHLSRERRFSVPRARFYAAEIVLAIEALHADGFIYRDLKPENVLIGADGNLCLTDFGLSKESVHDNELVHTFVGTTEYLAPEILRQRGYSKAVDWWSLGVLLYEMVVGSPPFYSKNRQLTFRLILSAEINFPEGMDAHCVHLIRALLTREPKKRLGSGSHGAADVRAHPFFESIDWASLMTKTVPPPFVPQTSSLPLNFDERYMKRTPIDSPIEAAQFPASQVSSSAFENFTYMSPSAFPDAMERESSTNTRSETPVGEDMPTPRDLEEKKDKDGRRDDSEGMFELDS